MNLIIKKISFKRAEGHNIEQKIEAYIEDTKDVDMLVILTKHNKIIL